MMVHARDASTPRQPPARNSAASNSLHLAQSATVLGVGPLSAPERSSSRGETFARMKDSTCNSGTATSSAPSASRVGGATGRRPFMTDARA